MTFEVVAEAEHPLNFRVRIQEGVQMEAWLDALEEKLAASNSQLATVFIPKSRQCRDLLAVERTGKDYQDVDNRLRGQTWHGSAANMFDLLSIGTNDNEQLIPLSRKKSWPGPIIFGDYDFTRARMIDRN